MKNIFYIYVSHEIKLLKRSEPSYCRSVFVELTNLKTSFIFVKPLSRHLICALSLGVPGIPVCCWKCVWRPHRWNTDRCKRMFSTTFNVYFLCNTILIRLDILDTFLDIYIYIYTSFFSAALGLSVPVLRDGIPYNGLISIFRQSCVKDKQSAR